MVIGVVWGFMIMLIIILVCNHRNGCISCDCLRDDPPDIEEAMYNTTMMPYQQSDTTNATPLPVKEF